MRNKNLVQKKLERVESIIKNIRFHLNRNERMEASQELDKIDNILSEVQTFLNTEDQE